MNERINKLALQAEQYARDDLIERRAVGAPLYTEGEYENKIKQKFAELIVLECAGLFPNVYVEIENEYGHTPVIAADYIKEHFGVES
jgi:hypothetical protein